MTISFSCVCSRRLRVPQTAAGKKLKCPACGSALTVPLIAKPIEERPAPIRVHAPAPQKVQVPAPKKVPAPAPKKAPEVPSPIPFDLADESFDHLVSTPVQSSWTLDDSALASNPGGLKVNLLVWFSNYPLWPLGYGMSLLAFVGLSILLHWAFWIAAALSLLLNLFYWQRVRDHFRYGNVCPGVIVSLDPMLIAVSTDLSKGEGQFPVIKIIEKSLGNVNGSVPKVGDRIATVALYFDMNPSSPSWSSFEPRPVECATTDLNVIRRMVQSISESDWQELYCWLQQVPRPLERGQYPIQAMF